jgi:hypothetical protein
LDPVLNLLKIYRMKSILQLITRSNH